MTSVDEQLNSKTLPMCGIVMPISGIDGCSETHWSDVLTIVKEAISAVNFQSNLVSNADESGAIHKRIIENLYDNPIVVVDVSGKNPNVMFELGMRLAFDKPTIIIKDDKTTYSFDTSSIEHIEYPRDLRFNSIVEFKNRLGQKIKATYERSKTDPNYTTFLKHFGSFKVAKIDKKEISGQEFIIEELKSLRAEVAKIQNPVRRTAGFIRGDSQRDRNNITICLGNAPLDIIEQAKAFALTYKSVKDIQIKELSSDHTHLTIYFSPDNERDMIEIEDTLREMTSSYKQRSSKSRSSV